VVCNQSIQINPKQQIAWVNKAFVLDQLQRYEEAISAYQIILQMDPSDMRSMRNCGIAFYENAQAHLALGLLETVAKKLSSDAINWCYLGLSHYQLGNIDHAILALQNSLKLDPHNQEVHQHLGRCLLKLGQFHNGLQAISRSTGSITFNLKDFKAYINE
jgi:tetratricopeptide (TPR) repeat protein